MKYLVLAGTLRKQNLEAQIPCVEEARLFISAFNISSLKMLFI